MCIRDRLYDVKNLVFDFSDVTFMDSSGIGVVLGRYKKIRAMGGTVAIREMCIRDSSYSCSYRN